MNFLSGDLTGKAFSFTCDGGLVRTLKLIPQEDEMSPAGTMETIDDPQRHVAGAGGRQVHVHGDHVAGGVCPHGGGVAGGERTQVDTGAFEFAGEV